jgi:hypothetical protein
VWINPPRVGSSSDAHTRDHELAITGTITKSNTRSHLEPLIEIRPNS